MKLSFNAKKALKIGTLCAMSYLAVYVARNALSSVTPKLLKAGFTESFIASLSSLFFVAYAVGQLINGALGDRIKAKYMLSVGLFIAGASSTILPFILNNATISIITYALTGFGLSMIYAPMTKVVAENNEPHLATRISLGYTFSSFFGSPMAGLLATFFAWQTVFYLSSAFLIIMAIVVLTLFFSFERKGLVVYNLQTKTTSTAKNYGVLFKRQIIKFSFVSIITGIVRTSVVFWLPTYINKYLMFSVETSTLLFTIASLVLCSAAFIAVFVYERFKRNLDVSVNFFFVLSALMFLLTFLIKTPVLNITFIVLSIIFSNCSSSLMWSVYCPSLRDTGVVSSATGYLDFLSYMAAAGANLFFADASTTLGWQNLILVWLGLMVLAIIFTIPYRMFKNKKTTI